MTGAPDLDLSCEIMPCFIVYCTIISINSAFFFFANLQAQKIRKVKRKTLEGSQVGIVMCDRRTDRNGTVYARIDCLCVSYVLLLPISVTESSN